MVLVQARVPALLKVMVTMKVVGPLEVVLNNRLEREQVLGLMAMVKLILRFVRAVFLNLMEMCVMKL